MSVIYIDGSIAGGEEAFGRLGDVVPFDSHLAADDPTILAGAEVLVTRSVTRIDARLLESAPGLLAVASPTIGTDHVDFTALDSYRRKVAREVPFYHSPGATAGGVADFALAMVIEAAGKDRFLTVGIWGYGNCGKALGTRLDRLGFPWVAYDPPLAATSDFESAGLDAVMGCDVVSLHVPLTFPDGSKWPTNHMIGTALLDEMDHRRTILVNTSRGAVVDNEALARHIGDGSHATFCLDVWEGEPEPDPFLVESCRLSSPHCAGSVVEGRSRALDMIFDSIASFLGVAARPGASDRGEGRAPFASRPRDLLEHVGLAELSTRFKSEYFSAAPGERKAVFERVRAGADRHELEW